MRIIFALLIFCFLGGCATGGKAFDAYMGRTSFAPVSGTPEFVYEKHGGDGHRIALALDGKIVSRDSDLKEKEWWGLSKWHGMVGEAYVKIDCSVADRKTGLRTCKLEQVDRCAMKGQTGFLEKALPDDPYKMKKSTRCEGEFDTTDVFTQVVAAPESVDPGVPLVARSGSTARRFSAEFWNNGAEFDYRLVFDFDNTLVASTRLTTLVLAMQGAGLVFSGSMQDIEGEIFCNVVAKDINDDYQYLCKAFTGFDSDRALIGQDTVTIPNRAITISFARAIIFYQLDRWPRLNPERSYEVPYESDTQTISGALMQEALTIYE